MPNPKINASDSKSNVAESKNNNAATKTTAVDSKNISNTNSTTATATSTRNNNADSKNNNADTKSNNPPAKNNNADAKNNNPDVKNNNSAAKNNNADAKNSDHAQGDCGGGGGGSNVLSPHGAAQASDGQHSLNGNKVYKSGPLFLSSKGIGWTSWKKRWFVLTQTSLVFFRSDPNAAPQRGGEVNLTLGGIDLNSSGSVVVKADKKLLTVLFPDGRDGRAFTLKAETTEDLNEWKAALEEALANAPSVSTGTGQPGTKNEKGDAAEDSPEQSKDRSSPKSMVLGRPILLALEDIDGTPSFLEKALRYVEDHGVKVEGILRQAADVEDVERRIREYEQGKVEFTAEEDAHVIGDCIKYVLRELPSSPVPASCCNALLDAFRSDRATRVGAMRAAICDTFPEPNRCLLQRILIMMETVAENKSVNRMSVSAVAACMAPLLLRPLLAGECNLESQFSMGGDGSAQLLQAAAAANHAQAIVITLLEEYDNIFGEGDMLSDLYSDSEELGSESEELSDEIYEEESEDGDYTSEGSNGDEDSEHASTSSESKDDRGSYQSQRKGPSSISSRSISRKVTDDSKASEKLLSNSHDRSCQVGDNVSNQNNDHQTTKKVKPVEHSGDDNLQAKKKFSNINYEEAEVKRLEANKDDLKEKVEAEARGNTVLKEDLLTKKKALEERRLALEQDVARLQEQLQKEIELRKKLEAGIKISQTVLSPNEKDTDKHQFPSFSTKLPPAHQFDSARNSKDINSGKDSDDKHKFHSFSTRLLPNQQFDSSRNPKDMRKSSSSKPKRLNSKTEQTGASSAMSKITSGFNFLKERSNQLADDFQRKGQSSQKFDKGSRKGSDEETEGQLSVKPKENTFQHMDSVTDRGSRRLEDQSATSPNLEKGKSESLSVDKSRDERTHSR